MAAERIARDALMPWLVLAICLHALAVLGVRVDLSTARVRERPVLEVSLAPREPPATAAQREGTPAPEQNTTANAPKTDSPALDRPRSPESEASRVIAAEAAEPAPVIGVQRREVEPDPAPTTSDSQPERRSARTPAGDRVAQPKPTAASMADSAEADAPAENPARVDVATLERQISDWSAEYSQRVAAEPGLPPRNAYVEKVVSNRVAAAAYERDWQDKVERVGNMNYPEEARKKNLTGGLTVSVGVNADGTVHAIRVRRSSGHRELDEAAQRIVELAAPFAAFPEDLKKDYDVLWITRTWRFYVDNHLATSP